MIQTNSGVSLPAAFLSVEMELSALQLSTALCVPVKTATRETRTTSVPRWGGPVRGSRPVWACLLSNRCQERPVSSHLLFTNPLLFMSKDLFYVLWSAPIKISQCRVCWRSEPVQCECCTFCQHLTVQSSKHQWSDSFFLLFQMPSRVGMRFRKKWERVWDNETMICLTWREISWWDPVSQM